MKINSQVYLNILKNVIKPWIDANYLEGGYVWQQDSASLHKSRAMQIWCSEHFEGFWPWTMRPPSSPDLLPLDYAVWGEVERKACTTTPIKR